METIQYEGRQDNIKKHLGKKLNLYHNPEHIVYHHPDPQKAL